ncbi:MAG: DNA polymerase III subunit gamma/tau [Cytophagia bacterium]|nr:MAG: DNA polymerase III subunit gamma/tau [Cytophagia bacterium]TAG42458.1 MAG: DNA polymerase III subunit gamma/tau [Cytophagia bacterium]
MENKATQNTQFVVSARKYRPAIFNTVVGQGHITTTLKNALKNNHLAQAFLFCGPRGVGKTTCARILGKTINCMTPTEEYEACGQCDNCKSFENNSSLSVYELDAASNNSVEDIRNLVEQVRFPPPAGSKRKVYIIDEVHMLSNAAFNAFLKTLEEPPSYVIFILATTEKHKIIPTILSRCQIFDFKRIEPFHIADHLKEIANKENIKFDYEGLELIAQKADGGLRDALSLFDMLATFGNEEGITYENTLANLHILDYDYYFKIIDAIWNENIAKAWLVFDEILKKGFDGQNFIVGLAKHLRDLLVCKDESTLQLLEVGEKIKNKYKLQSKTVNLPFLYSGLQIITNCEAQYKTSKAPKLHVELALLKLAHIKSTFDWDALAEEVEKKKLIQTSQPNQIESSQTQEPTSVYQKSTEIISAKPSITTPKIGISLAELSKTVKEEKKNETIKPPVNLSEDLIMKALDKYKRIQSNPKYDRVLAKIPTIIDEKILHFRLENEEINTFNLFKDNLLEKIRYYFSNPTIEITVEEYTPEKIEPLYTNRNRYDYLSKRFEILEQISDELGLMLDV